ncbi:unnamed protein product [Schistosoma margrebowiei]|uniref:Uncharacterized protein n=1 Tax=Schistosoma margrebowiei TaxID=48269 RepID=A0A183M5W6_9TREM|nr:unnamed protein product [Schistosoma margrebowiei]
MATTTIAATISSTIMIICIYVYVYMEFIDCVLECELEAVNNVDEDLRQSKQDTDEDHATRLKLLRQDLSSVRNPNKMQAIDIHYEDIVSKGMDKYRTLRAIREGNTKKRVDQFESM